MTIGSGENGNLSFIDFISLISFYVGLENLSSNISQEDVQQVAEGILNEIHSHLQTQDEKIDRILEVLNEGNQVSMREDSRRDPGRR